MNTLAMIAVTLSCVCAVAFALAPQLIKLLRGFRVRQELLEQQVAALGRDLEWATATGAATVTEVKRLRERESALMDRVGVLELRGSSRPFDQAIDAARRGDDPAKLSQQFGLSQGEAELLRVLHGAQRRRGAMAQ